MRPAIHSIRLLARHPAFRAAPLATLARIARWQWRSRRAAGLIRTDWINGAVLLAARGHSGASGNIYFGLHEYADMAFFAHLLRAGDTFIDAGANVGAYGVMAGVVSDARVHAIEPAGETLPVLKANLEANAVKHSVHPVALGDADGTARFTSGRGAMNQLDTSGTAQVEMRRLDGLGIEAIAMKADLEGGETAMLRGASYTLQSLWAIELETVDAEGKAILRAAGFVRRGYEPATRQLLDAPGERASNQLWISEPRLAEVKERLRDGPTIRYGRFEV